MADGKKIALFGGTGNTGSEFLKLAIDAGFAVRALVRTASKVTVTSDKLTVIEGSITDADKVTEAVTGADYVVSMVGLMQGLKNYPKDMLLNFVKLMHPIMVKEGTKVFLYQGGAFCPAPGECKPMMVSVIRNTYGRFTGLEASLKDHDNVFKFLDSEDVKKSSVKLIVTRPGGMAPGESKKKAEVVKSPPSGVDVAFVDVARFSLEALENESLYGTYPIIG